MTAAVALAPPEPRYRFVPLHTSTAAQDAIDLMAGVGVDLDECQQRDLRDQMARHGDRWAATEVADVEPRQNGKNVKLAARQLWGLFLNPSDRVQTHTAHRFDTCLGHFRWVCELIESTPELLALVKDTGGGRNGRPTGIKDSNGKESIELRDGKRLLFKARSKGSGRGFTGDAVYFDEAFWLSDVGSLIPTLSARPDPQIWYSSSAPLPREESERLRVVMRRGRHLAAIGGSTRLCYLEYSADPDLVTDDPRALWSANVGLWAGRLSEDFSAVERESMTEEEYRRERLGIVNIDEDDAPGWSVVDAEQWEACRTEESPRAARKPGWWTGPVALAVEVTPDRSAASIVGAGPCREGAPGVRLLGHGEGTGWVLPAVLAAWEERDVVGVVVDPKGPAAPVIDDLEAAGVRVLAPSFDDVRRATADWWDAIAAGELVHRPAEGDALEVLTEQMGRAEWRSVGDARLLERRGGDRSAVVASMLALWGADRVDDHDPTLDVW